MSDKIEQLKEILKDKELLSLLKEALKEPEVKKVKKPRKPRVPKDGEDRRSEFANHWVDDLSVNSKLIDRNPKRDAEILKKITRKPREKIFFEKVCERCKQKFNGVATEFICGKCINAK